VKLPVEHVEGLPWRQAKSTNVERICWIASGEPGALREVHVDTEDDVPIGSLFVTFRKTGKTYHYADVPQDRAQATMEAESIGTALNQRIKTTYDFELIEVDTEKGDA